MSLQLFVSLYLLFIAPTIQQRSAPVPDIQSLLAQLADREKAIRNSSVACQVETWRSPHFLAPMVSRKTPRTIRVVEAFTYDASGRFRLQTIAEATSGEDEANPDKLDRSIMLSSFDGRTRKEMVGETAFRWGIVSRDPAPSGFAV